VTDEAREAIEKAANYWVLGKLQSSELPEWAYKMMLLGFDSEPFCVLAGERVKVAYVVEPLFIDCLAAVGCRLPSKEEAVWYFAVDLAKAVLEESIVPHEAAGQLRFNDWELQGQKREAVERVVHTYWWWEDYRDESVGLQVSSADDKNAVERKAFVTEALAKCDADFRNEFLAIIALDESSKAETPRT